MFLSKFITDDAGADGNSSKLLVSPTHEFSNSSFESLRDHFIKQILEYKSMQNFGRSLDFFASIDTPDICYEGFKSLYSNHRDKTSTWFYLLSAFSKIKEEGISGEILLEL
jgi:hypothetical protein